MKKLIFIFLVLLIPLSLEAQSNLTVKQLLDKTSESIAKDTGVETMFSTSIYRNGGLESSTKGTLWLRGNKFVLETDEMKTWYNGECQWSLIFDMEEVNLSEPTQEELTEINPYELLNLYKKGYSSSYLDATDRVVLLKSKDSKRNFQEIKLWISPRYQPRKIEVSTRDKRLISIQVTQFKQNLNLSNPLFSFNQKEYPDTEIIDLR